ALLAYQRLGINTIDLYLIWNWHEPSEGVRDFTGATNPRRDLLGLLKLTHELGFKLILRPGPVIRNEWQNGGYPPWLLRRDAYDMPLHDVLEGRYPATATLQNHDADAAGAEWLANETHRRYAARWLADALQTAAPYAQDVIAIALDDDQGAYLDNNTWPAPHWRAYIEWLRSTVRSVVGPHVPLFLNTYEMKVPAASPVWAWGNWYQSNAYRIGAHDLADLDFATGLLQTQTRAPLMQAEFQAGWLQGADEAAPRPSDPSNTVLALNQLLRNGAHGIVNFPAQDTIYPDGWEAPWANWSYAWDAAFTVDLGSSARYAPTAAFGDSIRRYGGLLARTHPEADAGIIWPPTLFLPRALTNDDFQAFADATAAMQHQCATLGLTCKLIDLAYADSAALKQLPALAMPILPSARLTAVMQPRLAAELSQLRRSGRLVGNLSLLARRPRARAIDSTILLANDRSFAFIAATNPSDQVRSIGPIAVKLAHRDVLVPTFALPARSARLIPVGVRSVAPSKFTAAYALASPPPFADDGAFRFRASGLSVAFAPNAGARIAELSAPGFTNAATSIGLLRDAVDPEPTPSARDYIAANTHPLPAGTFNRTYSCVGTQTLRQLQERCAYDAPDLPQGGARFERILTLNKSGNKLVVDLRYTPNDPTSSARLESISGFAFSAGDMLLTPGTAIGILHGTRLAMLRWSPGDVARVGLRQTRGAELVTLVFARKSVELWLSVLTARDSTEAQHLLDAKQP
ncbi:MAG: beta-galactosidase, partial [Candidatus Cybelea sp.]